MTLTHFFRLLSLCFFINLNAQHIRIPNSGTNTQKLTSLIQQEKNFGKDTLALQKHLLALTKTKLYLPLYNALLANGYTNVYDSITGKSKKQYLTSIQQATVSGDKSLQIWTRLNYVKRLYQYRYYQEMQPVLLELIQDIGQAEKNEILVPLDTYQTIGWIMQTLSDYPEANYYLKLALKHCEPNTSNHAALLDNYGINFYKTGHYEEALKQFDLAGTIALKVKDSLRYAKTLGNKAILFEEQEKYAQAILLLKEDIALSERLKEPKNTMFATIALARIYLKNKALTEAETVLNQAAEIAASKPYFRKSELEVMQLKLELLKSKPDAAEELVTSRRMLILQDSLKKKDGEEQIHLLKWQMQKAKYQQKLSQTNRLYEKELTKKNIFALLIGLSVLMAMMMYFVQKKRHNKRQDLYEQKVTALEEQKRKIEEKLKTSNESLSHQVEYLKDKNLQINRLKTEIEAVKTSASSYLEERRGKLNALLESHLMTDDNWSSFKREFEKEHPEFCQFLNLHFPELTNSNLRIIYLQKLRFNSLEISEFLGITPEAVKKSKQRLKKKLGGKFEKLSDFMQQ